MPNPPTLLTSTKRSVAPRNLCTCSRWPVSSAERKDCRQRVRRFLMRTWEGTTLAIPSLSYLSKLPPEEVPEDTEPVEPTRGIASGRISANVNAVRGHKTLGPASNLDFHATGACLDVAGYSEVALHPFCAKDSSSTLLDGIFLRG